MRPLFDRLLVRRAEVKDETPEGIIIPDMAKTAPQEGEVVSVGPGCKYVKDSDKVFFSQYCGTDITVGEETLIILSEQDILCVQD